MALEGDGVSPRSVGDAMSAQAQQSPNATLSTEYTIKDMFEKKVESACESNGCLGVLSSEEEARRFRF